MSPNAVNWNAQPAPKRLIILRALREPWRGKHTGPQFTRLATNAPGETATRQPRGCHPDLLFEIALKYRQNGASQALCIRANVKSPLAGACFRRLGGHPAH